MDCADRKPSICFLIWSPWIADQDEHAALKQIGHKSYPMCEVLGEDLGREP